MIPFSLRITLLIAVIVYFILILFYLKNKALELKYTLLWIFAGAAMLLMVIFPQILLLIKEMFGFADNMNALYVICFGFVIMLLMMLTSIVSRQANKVKILIQEIAILKKEIRDLQEVNKEKNEEDNTG